MAQTPNLQIGYGAILPVVTPVTRVQSLSMLKSLQIGLPLACLGAAIALSPAVAQTSLPTVDRHGDYQRRTSHSQWVVVDPDPNGLNCRWSSAMPADWYSPAAPLPAFTILDWPVVRRFRQGTVLTANTTPAGFATVTDTRGKPWLKVSIGPNDQICLVRANAQFIRPVR